MEVLNKFDYHSKIYHSMPQCLQCRTYQYMYISIYRDISAELTETHDINMKCHFIKKGKIQYL